MIRSRMLRETALVLVLVCTLAPGAHADDPRTLAHGSFEGRSGHSVSGSVEIVETPSGYEILLLEDFTLDGAPDPRLALGRNGYQPDTQFARLRHDSGPQSHALPAGIDPRDYTEVWLWCEAFSVPLGVATLEASVPRHRY